MKKKLLSILLSTVVLTGVLAGCGGSGSSTESTSESTSAGENVVTVGVSSDLLTLDPAQIYEMYGNMYTYACYDNLYKVSGETTEPVPSVAKSYTLSEDGLVYTFDLRDDVVFSSGNQMTSADIIFSVNRLINLKGNPSYNAENIKSIEANGDYSVIITLNEIEATGSLLAKLASNAFAILDSAVVKENGGLDTENAVTDDVATEYLNANSAGSGPYILENWTLNESMTLVKNENYWGECGNVDKFIVQEITDVNSEIQMLERGDLDVALELSNDNRSQIVNADTTIKTTQTDTVTFLFMNDDESISGPLANEKVRQAIGYAIDYNGLKSLCGEGAVSIASFEPLDMGGYERDEDYRDLDKAKELLAEAGYSDGFDTVLTVGNVVNEGMSWSVIGQKVQSDLAEVGINIEIQTVEAAVLYDDYRNGLSSFAVMYWSPDFYDLSNTALGFLPANVYNGLIGTRGNWNVEGEKIGQYESLAQVIKTSSDDDERDVAVRELQELYNVDGNCVFLLQHPKLYAYGPNVDNVNYNNLTKIMLSEINVK